MLHPLASARRRRPFIKEDPLAAVELRQADLIGGTTGADAHFRRLAVGGNSFSCLLAVRSAVRTAGLDAKRRDLFGFEHPRRVAAEGMRDDVLGRDVLEARYLPAAGRLSHRQEAFVPGNCWNTYEIHRSLFLDEDLE